MKRCSANDSNQVVVGHLKSHHHKTEVIEELRSEDHDGDGMWTWDNGTIDGLGKFDLGGDIVLVETVMDAGCRPLLIIRDPIQTFMAMVGMLNLLRQLIFIFCISNLSSNRGPTFAAYYFSPLFLLPGKSFTTVKFDFKELVPKLFR